MLSASVPYASEGIFSLFNKSSITGLETEYLFFVLNLEETRKDPV